VLGCSLQKEENNEKREDGMSTNGTNTDTNPNRGRQNHDKTKGGKGEGDSGSVESNHDVKSKLRTPNMIF
jgi:hypothetical protein